MLSQPPGWLGRYCGMLVENIESIYRICIYIVYIVYCLYCIYILYIYIFFSPICGSLSAVFPDWVFLVYIYISYIYIYILYERKICNPDFRYLLLLIVVVYIVYYWCFYHIVGFIIVYCYFFVISYHFLFFCIGFQILIESSWIDVEILIVCLFSNAFIISRPCDGMKTLILRFIPYLGCHFHEEVCS